MEYQDINNDPIKPGFYVETFYRRKDEWKNRIIYIAESPIDFELFSVINQANMVELNPRYSQWLKPFEQEKNNLQFPMSMDNNQICEPVELPPDLKHLEDQL